MKEREDNSILYENPKDTTISFSKAPFLKSDLLKNGFLLISGNAIGQLLSFLSYPILTRLYSTEDFGIFAMFLSITGLLSILSTGKYEDAFFISKDEKETSLILGFTLKVLIVFSLFLFISLWVISNFLHNNLISNYWYIISITVLVTGLFQILVSLANKKKNYKSIASSNISLNGFSSFFKILYTYISSISSGLIIGNLIGQIAAFVPFYKLKEDITKAFLNKWALEKKVGIAYNAFPLYNMTKTFVNSLSGNLPFLLLGLFGEAKLGLFSLAFTAVFRPINLVSNSFYQVFFQKTAQTKHSNERIIPVITDFWKKSLLFILPCFVIAFLFAQQIFEFIFGNNWKESGSYFQLILPWMFMVFITTPISFIPVIFEKQKQALVIEAFYFVARVIALYIGIYFSSFTLAILLFSIVGFTFMSILLLWYCILIINYDNKLVK